MEKRLNISNSMCGLFETDDFSNGHNGPFWGFRRCRKTPGFPGVLAVAPTGIEPVTFRFSVGRSTN